MPWHVWKQLPQNKGLTEQQALSKFEIERNNHLKRLMYYENQKFINDNLK